MEQIWEWSVLESHAKRMSWITGTDWTSINLFPRLSLLLTKVLTNHCHRSSRFIELKLSLMLLNLIERLTRIEISGIWISDSFSMALENLSHFTNDNLIILLEH